MTSASIFFIVLVIVKSCQADLAEQDKLKKEIKIFLNFIYKIYTIKHKNFILAFIREKD